MRRDGTSARVDLLKYYSTGNTDHNPYLRDGDIISIPTYDPDYSAVYVSGDLAFPGTYDHRPDDTLSDVLVLATGEDPPTGFTQVRVLRTLDDGSTSAEIYDLASLDPSLKIERRDQVHAVRDPVVRGSASIEGWVQYPGTYPILPGESTLASLVEKAGELREGALGRGAYLQRATLPPPEPQTSRQNRFEFAAPELELIRSDSMAILQNTRLASINFLSRAYLAHELRLQNRVPIDLSAPSADATMLLQDGDRVFVPRDERSVFVFGQVNRPGYVTYAPGASLEYYVETSGSFSENAGAVYLIEAGTSRYLDARSATIQSGDKIFVDRDVMQADSEVLQRLLTDTRRADLDERTRTVQSIVQSISAATAIVTTYLLIRREFGD
jgi:protein involved in polysaccharide export with SLBB domain